MKQNTTIIYLKQLSAQAECPCPCKLEIPTKLQAINLHELNAGEQMFYHYVFGKFYYELAKESENPNHLELANEQFDQLFITADQAGIVAKSGKYYFCHAYTKYLLADFQQTDEDATALLQRASAICADGLANNPSNRSLQWLQQTIANRA